MTVVLRSSAYPPPCIVTPGTRIGTCMAIVLKSSASLACAAMVLARSPAAVAKSPYTMGHYSHIRRVFLYTIPRG